MWMIAAIAILLPSVAMAFEPPSGKTIREAVGDLSGSPVVLQRAFAPDAKSFDPIPNAFASPHFMRASLDLSD
jgi:hypothetical protein